MASERKITMAKKKKIRERIKDTYGISPYEIEGSIVSAIENLQWHKDNAERAGYKNICLEDKTSWNELSFFEVWGTRDETDKEQEKRLKKEVKDKKKRKKIKYEEYLKLKAEFEDGVDDGDG